MKLQKALSLTLGTLLLTSALALPASAMKAIGNVNVPYGSPKIDGKIDAAEWKNAGTFTVDSTTAKSWHIKFPENFSADIRVMWDETNLYLTGTIKDPNVSFSTEGKYNRDAFQVSIDLGQTLFNSSENRAIFYSFGCYEDGTGMLQRQESKNDAVVKDGEEGLLMKTVKTSDGWNFETAIPFNMLKTDNKLKSGKTTNVAAGTKLNMMACYLDNEGSDTRTSMFGTTLTDESVAYDWGPKDHGITLVLEAKKAAPAAAPATADPAALAILAAAASGAAVVVSKKRK
ncbi:MAG: hypothetical protein J6I45_03475 [Clostridia bacterium]|nr:hypothetical protein [Clostridia bacterium]